MDFNKIAKIQTIPTKERIPGKSTVSWMLQITAAHAIPARYQLPCLSYCTTYNLLQVKMRSLRLITAYLSICQGHVRQGYCYACLDHKREAVRAFGEGLGRAENEEDQFAILSQITSLSVKLAGIPNYYIVAAAYVPMHLKFYSVSMHPHGEYRI